MMRVLSQPQRLLPSSILCLGTFDGMHRGHQALLAASMQPGHHSAVATFLDHPARVLAPAKAPARLQSTAQRERVCQALGLSQLVYLPFTPQIAAMSPQAFVQRFLLDELAPVRVVVGDDFRFGAKRAGDPALLTQLLGDAGIEVTVIQEQCLATGERLSSTAVRRCVQAGDLPGAQAILGRPYALSAPVVHGCARGRTLKLPTANLSLSQCLPPQGVYAGWVPDQRPGSPALWQAVANLGRHPTFGESEELKFEVHLLDCPDQDAPHYGETLEFHLVARLRDEQRFENPQMLKAAIAQDISRARALLGPASRAAIKIEPLAPAP